MKIGDFYDITYAGNCVTFLNTLLCRLGIDDYKEKILLFQIEGFAESGLFVE